MMNTTQQEKEGLVEYMESFTQEKSIKKISIGENVLGCFVNTTKQCNKLDEVEDADEIINTKKNNLKPDKRWFS